MNERITLQGKTVDINTESKLKGLHWQALCVVGAFGREIGSEYIRSSPSVKTSDVQSRVERRFVGKGYTVDTKWTMKSPEDFFRGNPGSVTEVSVMYGDKLVFRSTDTHNTHAGNLSSHLDATQYKKGDWEKRFDNLIFEAYGIKRNPDQYATVSFTEFLRYIA